MGTPSKAEAFTEETTKVAADFVSAVQSTTEAGRILNHPVRGLYADLYKSLLESKGNNADWRFLMPVSVISCLLVKSWFFAAVGVVGTAFFWWNTARLKKAIAERKKLLETATDDYMNAEVRAQMAPAMAAAALRLAQLPRDQVVFIDAEDKQWTAKELMALIFQVGSAGEQTILQFLLSCAVFGFPLGRDDQEPLNELNLERLTSLRSTTTWVPRTPPESGELPN